MGGGVIGKFMNKKPKSALLTSNTRVENNKTNGKMRGGFLSRVGMCLKYSGSLLSEAFQFQMTS